MSTICGDFRNGVRAGQWLIYIEVGSYYRGRFLGLKIGGSVYYAYLIGFFVL